MTSILLNLSKGGLLPAGDEMLGHTVHDSLCRLCVGEDPNGPRVTPDLPEGPLQDVRGLDLRDSEGKAPALQVDHEGSLGRGIPDDQAEPVDPDGTQHDLVSRGPTPGYRLLEQQVLIG